MMTNLLRLTVLALIIGLATGCGTVPDRPAAADRAANHASSMVGKPYRYGGNSPQTGFDCSGLIQWSYARAGLRIPHGTSQLRRVSRPISLRHANKGDLVFFTQLGKSSSHVGIYIGDDRFVHAPSTGKNVYIARLTDPYWRKHLDEVRRLDTD